MNPANRNPGHLSLRLWLNSAAAVTLLVGLAVAAISANSLPETPSVSKLNVGVPKPLGARAQDGMADAPMPVDLYRFALNAFLVPLLDDSEPRRWTDMAIDFSCNPGTRVMVDGEPMVVGKLIPTSAFTVRWTMHNCALLGRESVELNGNVALVVFRTETGLRATVQPDDLRVDSHLGRAWLHGPFVADTPLAVRTGDRPSTFKRE